MPPPVATTPPTAATATRGNHLWWLPPPPPTIPVRGGGSRGGGGSITDPFNQYFDDGREEFGGRFSGESPMDSMGSGRVNRPGFNMNYL